MMLQSDAFAFCCATRSSFVRFARAERVEGFQGADAVFWKRAVVGGSVVFAFAGKIRCLVRYVTVATARSNRFKGPREP